MEIGGRIKKKYIHILSRQDMVNIIRVRFDGEQTEWLLYATYIFSHARNRIHINVLVETKSF